MPVLTNFLYQIWVVTMYLGQVLKEILQMPRPTCPPAYPMENQHKVSFIFIDLLLRINQGRIWISLDSCHRRQFTLIWHIVLFDWTLQCELTTWLHNRHLVHRVGLFIARLQGHALLAGHCRRFDRFGIVHHTRLVLPERCPGAD